MGTVAGMLVGRFFEGDPFYLNAKDLAPSAAAVLALALTGGLAALLPARRALRIDPMRALRHD